LAFIFKPLPGIFDSPDADAGSQPLVFSAENVIGRQVNIHFWHCQDKRSVKGTLHITWLALISKGKRS
jgi:hypothetical protein